MGSLELQMKTRSISRGFSLCNNGKRDVHVAKKKKKKKKEKQQQS